MNTQTVLVLVLLGSGLAACSEEPGHGAPSAAAPASSQTPLSPTLSPTESATAGPDLAGDDWIVFESAARISYIGLDGESGTAPSIRLDEVPSPQDNPDWSPDGRRITFVSNDGLWVMSADGADAHLLAVCSPPCAYLDDPAWSPDGKVIAVSRTIDRDGTGSSSLLLADARTGGTTAVLGPLDLEATAGVDWSPDGRHLVFELIHKADPAIDPEVTSVDLAVLDLADAGRGMSELRTLVDPYRWPETAAWSPDGSRIAFGYRASRKDDAVDLFTIHPDGTHLTRVTELAGRGGWATHPTWTRDSTRLIFAGSRDGDTSSELLTVAADGGQVDQIGPSPVFGSHPKVRPAP